MGTTCRETQLGGTGGPPTEIVKQIIRTTSDDWVQVDHVGRVVLKNHVFNYCLWWLKISH